MARVHRTSITIYKYPGQARVFCYDGGMSEQRGKWQKRTSKKVHENAFFYVTEDDVIRPDGSEGKFFSVVQPVGGVMIVAMDDKEQMLLIGLHRYAVDKYSLEVPGGRIDDNEPLEAAKIELREEAGLQAENWKLLGTTHPAKGLLNETNYIYLATGLTQTDDNEQEEEGIEETRWVPFEQIWGMIEAGEITDGQTITALALVAIELHKLG